MSRISLRPRRGDGMSLPQLTVVEALAELASSSSKDRGFTFIDSRGREEPFTPFDTLARDVAERAGALFRAGLKRGDHVALVIPERREFVLTFLGALWGGVIPVPLAPPIGLDHLSTYLERSRHIIEASHARTLITTARIKAVSGSLLDGALRNIVAIEELSAESTQGIDLNPSPLDGTAFIQFTSGSTSNPRGVLLTHRNLAVNCHCLAKQGLGMTVDDVVCSWLPFFHDFGLIGMVMAPIFVGSSAVYMPPLLFLKRPVEWLRAVTRYSATVSFAPNFGYGLCAKRVAETDLEGLDLTSWRYAGCGAEPVRMTTLRAFAEKFEGVGFKRDALMPGYGLAESTLAVCFDKGVQGPDYDRLDPDKLYEKGRAEVTDRPNALEVACCGAPFEGHEAKIVDDLGRTCPDRVVGEIVLKGPSVMTGYYDNPVATETAIKDGWLQTGDLGYMVDGRIYITGRRKEIIIVAGRNYYPTDIEHAVSQLHQVRTGNVVAFGTSTDELEEKLIVCAETGAAPHDYSALADKIRGRVMEAVGLEVQDVLLLEPGTLPKTSSGKLQRCDVRQAYLQHRLANRPGRDTKLATFKHIARSQLRILWSKVSGTAAAGS